VVLAKSAESLDQKDILLDVNQQRYPQSSQDFQEQIDAETLRLPGELSVIPHDYEHAILEDGSHGVLQDQRKIWISCEDEPIR
jgi:hypothetical protein